MSKESVKTEYQQYVGPYRLEKTLGKGQTGNTSKFYLLFVKYSLHLIL